MWKHFFSLARTPLTRRYRILDVALVVLSLVAASQGQRTPQPQIDPFPDEHRPPSVSDMARMEQSTPKNQPLSGNSAAPDEACLLPPLTLMTSPSVSAAQLQLPARARGEYQKACAALKKRKTAYAEKHLKKAVTDAPKYAAAWVLMGQVLDEQGRTDEARRDCLQGSVAESSYVPAYLCLAQIASRAGIWDEVLKLAARAIELDPSNNAVAYEFHASALLNLHDLPAAEKSALRALAIDLNHREPRVHFLLAQVYEAKGDAVSEAMELREYLKFATDQRDIAFVKQALSKLDRRTQNSAISDGPPLRSVTKARPNSVPRWAPEDVDEWVPPVLSRGGCPLPKILEQAANRTGDLIDSLQRFSATEHIMLTDTDKHGRKRHSSASEVNYVAQIVQTSSGYPRIEEYRSHPEDRQPSVLDSGIAAFALIFHPTHIGTFEFQCEGLTQLRGSSAWQLRFEESADPNKAFTAITVGRSIYLPRFKGRAWIASSTGEVLRIETDLVAPITQIDLQLEHMVIDYAPVDFPTRQVRLWLPKSTDIYLSYRGHHYERTHTFTQFQLFWVDSSEAVKNKLADNALPGQDVR